MPDFVAHALDPVAARDEVADLKTLLGGSWNLKEAVFRDFFRARLNASALIGPYNPGIQRVDRVAHEYPLFGDFRCDLAISDSVSRACTFVEFEGAGPGSLFVKHGNKATREWSPRFDHGYSQVIDWFHKLQDMTNTAAMEARFGKRAIDYNGVLVVGRNRHINVGEHERMRWRASMSSSIPSGSSASPTTNCSMTWSSASTGMVWAPGRAVSRGLDATCCTQPCGTASHYAACQPNPPAIYRLVSMRSSKFRNSTRTRK